MFSSSKTLTGYLIINFLKILREIKNVEIDSDFFNLTEYFPRKI